MIGLWVTTRRVLAKEYDELFGMLHGPSLAHESALGIHTLPVSPMGSQIRARQ